jgi:NADH-quinone oxidoreductase subunit A
LTGRDEKPNLNAMLGCAKFLAVSVGKLQHHHTDLADMIPYDWQYLPLLMQTFAAFLLGLVIVGASWLIGRHKNTDTKLAAYECGIEAVGDARGRFSVRFYLVAMLFILFDVEAVFMFPWAVIYRRLPAITGQRLFGFWEMVVYLGFVGVGLYYIVRKGILNWSQDKADL